MHTLTHHAHHASGTRCRRAGRKTTAHAYDAMIAATAVANDLPIYTCNPANFSGIDGVDVIAIAIPEAG
jgi:tRNA(fMet)-specific endonuclease VapC